MAVKNAAKSDEATALRRRWRAPAKVNLTLHILGRDVAGWHELDSLVAFAGCSDWLDFAPGRELDLTVAGPRAAQVGANADNLVMRAAKALAARIPTLRLGHFHLHKTLPAAAGLGGGSADAAAALRALAQANALSLDDPRVLDAATATGSDVAVCLHPRMRMMAGRGERVGPPLRLAPLFAVLANPGVGVATSAVFAALNLPRGAAAAWPPAPRLGEGASQKQLRRDLLGGRNDLQAAAIALAPEIAHALQTLERQRGAWLARMSGSGATCFALFERRRDAVEAADKINLAFPNWWVKPTLLR